MGASRLPTSSASHPPETYPMRPLSRRDFMYDSAWLAAAAAGLSTTSAFAAEEPPQTRKGPASEKWRVAVVGVNGRGMSPVGAFANRHNCVITTICDAASGVIGRAMKEVEAKQGKAPKFEQDIRKVVE